MSETQTESAEDADTDSEEQFTYYPQVTQHPTTIIEGDVVELVTGADLDSNKEETNTSFGVVLEDPVLGAGEIWKNDQLPDLFASVSEYNDMLRIAINGDDLDYVRGFEVTDERIEEARERMDDQLGGVEKWSAIEYDEAKIGGSDFKIANSNDRDAGIQYNSDGDESGIDVGGGEFSSTQVDDFGDVDRIMIWYGGISGQRIGRTLDACGSPFARFTDPDDGDLPYLVKGLLQAPLGWRNTQSNNSDTEQYGVTKTRDQLKDEETYPRVARPPVLRADLDGRIFIGVGRFQGGNGFEPVIGEATDDYEAVVEVLSDDDTLPWEKEYPTEIIEMRYDQDIDDVLNESFDNAADIYTLYHGEGWMDEPDEIQGALEGSDGGSFDTPSVDVDGDSVDHPTDQEVEFGHGIAEQLAGTGASPDEEIFPHPSDDEDGNVNLEEIVNLTSDQFNVTPDVDAIRRVIYENTGHLDAGDL